MGVKKEFTIERGPIPTWTRSFCNFSGIIEAYNKLKDGEHIRVPVGRYANPQSLRASLREAFEKEGIVGYRLHRRGNAVYIERGR